MNFPATFSFLDHACVRCAKLSLVSRSFFSTPFCWTCLWWFQAICNCCGFPNCKSCFLGATTTYRYMCSRPAEMSRRIPTYFGYMLRSSKPEGVAWQLAVPLDRMYNFFSSETSIGWLWGSNTVKCSFGDDDWLNSRCSNANSKNSPHLVRSPNCIVELNIKKIICVHDDNKLLNWGNLLFCEIEDN